MVRILVFIILLPLFSFTVKKGSDSDFQKNFNVAKQHLSQRRIIEALPYLLYLNKHQPANENLKYLIGVCYAESGIVNPKTLELLSEASKNVSIEYNPNSLEEQRVPIYVYYYLSLAYSQNKMCDEAELARNKFLEIYPYDDKYYKDESLLWLEKCHSLTTKPKEVKLPVFPNFKPFVSDNKLIEKQPEKIEVGESKKQIKKNKVKSKIITKQVQYSTSQPLYGVQLGAFKEVVSVSRFNNLKNVDAFIDTVGLIRYVIGRFSLYSQAESLQKVIRKKGFFDAFIVDVNSAKKFEEEVVSVDNVNINHNPLTFIEYRVQIGAFKESLTNKTAKIYTKIEGIKEIRDEGITYLTVGKFKSYAEAKAHSKEIIGIGVSDAFVIATKSGKKVSLEQVNILK